MTLLGNTHRAIALIMASLMFFSSAGLAIDMHFCQGNLKSISLLGKAPTCHDMVDESMKKCKHHKKKKAIKKNCSEDKNCCSNKTVRFNSAQDQQIQYVDFVVSKQLQQFVIAYVASFMAKDLAIVTNAIPFAHYKPPLIQRDIPILNQTFLL